MEQEKSNVGTIILAIIITAVVVSGGVYMWQKNQVSPPTTKEVAQPAVTTPAKEEPTEPLSYSTAGVSATVSKKTAPFNYTAEQLKGMADECGSQHDTGYFDKLVSEFSGATETIYSFKYTGASQASDTFTVTLLPNEAGYTSLDQFKKDFDICAAGGNAYPTKVNSHWLLFINSCGSGFDDGSGRPIGCDKVREVIEPTLTLN